MPYPREIKEVAQKVGVTTEELAEIHRYLSAIQDMRPVSAKEAAVNLRKCLKEITEKE